MMLWLPNLSWLVETVTSLIAVEVIVYVTLSHESLYIGTVAIHIACLHGPETLDMITLHSKCRKSGNVSHENSQISK